MQKQCQLNKSNLSSIAFDQHSHTTLDHWSQGKLVKNQSTRGTYIPRKIVL